MSRRSLDDQQTLDAIYMSRVLGYGWPAISDAVGRGKSAVSGALARSSDWPTPSPEEVSERVRSMPPARIHRDLLAKSTDPQTVIDIRYLRSLGYGSKRLGRMYGLSWQAAHRILTGQTYRNLPLRPNRELASEHARSMPLAPGRYSRLKRVDHRGERNPAAKLNSKLVERVRQLSSLGMSAQAIKQALGLPVHASSVNRVATGETWAKECGQ